MSTFVFKIDHYVAKLFHNIYVWGGEFSNHVMEGISLLAEAGILFLIIGLGLSLFKRTRKIGGVVLISVALGFLTTNIILKNMIERTRPFGDISSDFYKWWLDAGATHESGYSFPSGHTTATTAFAIAIFLTTNKKYSWPILSLPLLMASSRIYLMVHYFSDCVGAWIVGIVVAILAYIIVTLAYKSKLKFFVWIREFNIITPKQKIQISTENVPQNKVEDYVYTTQSEDQTISNIEDNRLIQKEIATKEENNTSDK